MHAGRRPGDRERGALAVLRPGRHLHHLRQPAQVQEPGLGLLLRAHQRHAEDRGAAGQEAAAGAGARVAPGHTRVRPRLQRLPGGRGRREGAEGPALQGRAVGTPDHRAGPVPALLPAGRAGVGPDRPGRHCQRGAGRRCLVLIGQPQGHGHTTGATQDGPGRRLQRVGPGRRRHRQRQGRRDRQPALPVGRLRALLPVARDRARTAGRVRRHAVRRAGGADRPHQGPGLVAHRGHRLAADAVRAQARAGRPVQLPPGRPADEDEGHQADRGRRRRPAAHADRLRDRPRPHVHIAAGPAPVPVDDRHRLRDGRRERGQLPLPQPLLRDQQGAERCASTTPSSAATRASRG